MNDFENATETVVETDNSEVVENQEPETSDNSEETTQIQEPEQEQEEVAEHKEQQGQFKSLEDAEKSYQELRKLNGQQASELGELRKKSEAYDKLQAEINAQKLQEAQQNGFNTVQEYSNSREVAQFIANEYQKHLNACDYPDEMRSLLEQYKVNPNSELLETIEAEFPLSTVKQIARESERFEGQLQAQANEAQVQQITQSAREYLEVNVNKYQEEFKNPAFAQLYGEAFKAIGCDLDTDKFVGLMREFANEVIKAEGFKKDVAKENKEATDEIAGLTVNGTPKDSGNLMNLSDDDMKARLTELL